MHTAAGWTDWRPVSREGDHAPDEREALDRAPEEGPDRLITSDPTWVGVADGWQLGLGAAAHDVRVHLVRADASADAAPADPNTPADPSAPADGFTPQRSGIPANAAPTASVPADAGEAALGTARLAGERPAVFERWHWSARAPRNTNWTATSLRLAVVHHTGSGESSTYAEADVPAMLRAVQAYHMDANGWNDIGYNFVVDRFGRIWEGREGGIDTITVGAHAYGLNTGSLGVVVLGDFRSAAPSAAAMDGVARLLAWKLFRHGADPGRNGTELVRDTDRYPGGQPVTLPRIIGHQDVNSTGCPGTIEAYLPQLRADVATRYRAMVGEARLTDGTIGGPGSVGPGGDAKPIIGDFDKDGRDDILWYGPGTAPDALWSSNGAGGFRARSLTIDEDGTATPLDWDGDGATDLLLSVPGRTTVRLLSGVPATAGGGMTSMTLNASGDAVPVVGDFDADGDEDVLFYEPTQQRAKVFGYDTGSAAGPTLAVPGGPYRPAVGDFDGDQRDDIMWYAPGTAADAVWYGRSPTSFATAATAVSGDLQPLVADLNGDQRDDIVWRHPGSGLVPIWLGGASFTATQVDYGAGQQLALADLDGGGSADVISVWSSGWAMVWLRHGDGERLGRQDAVPAGSRAVPADFDGDGRRELWWWLPGSVAQDGALWRAT
ncbi:MAG: N-acetylmuramoyl-L-alanine amidase [Acidimicrobiales bacterium]